MLYVIPISIVSTFLGTTVAFVVGLLISLVSFAAFALVLFGAWQCHQGVLLRYPLNLR